MMDVKLQSLEKFDRLEQKIEQALQRLTDLTDRHETLQRSNALLQERVQMLQNRNIALSREIDELRAATAANEDDHGEEILKRIDRMLEKFGELQI
jgi:FtsZ-binding cell division protein ZapB